MHASDILCRQRDRIASGKLCICRPLFPFNINTPHRIVLPPPLHQFAHVAWRAMKRRYAARLPSGCLSPLAFYAEANADKDEKKGSMAEMGLKYCIVCRIRRRVTRLHSTPYSSIHQIYLYSIIQTQSRGIMTKQCGRCCNSVCYRLLLTLRRSAATASSFTRA